MLMELPGMSLRPAITDSSTNRITSNRYCKTAN